MIHSSICFSSVLTPIKSDGTTDSPQLHSRRAAPDKHLGRLLSSQSNLREQASDGYTGRRISTHPNRHRGPRGIRSRGRCRRNSTCLFGYAGHADHSDHRRNQAIEQCTWRQFDSELAIENYLNRGGTEDLERKFYSPRSIGRIVTTSLSVASSMWRVWGLEATVVVNPELIGGARITVGDAVIDGTVQEQLRQMATQLRA